MTRKEYNNPPQVKSKKSVNSSACCELCSGSGWRPVVFEGRSAVTKCVCRGGHVFLPGVDFKTLAAGER